MHFWVTFSFKMLLQEYLGETPKFFPVGPFFVYHFWNVYRSVLIARNLPMPRKIPGCAPLILKFVSHIFRISDQFQKISYIISKLRMKMRTMKMMKWFWRMVERRKTGLSWLPFLPVRSAVVVSQHRKPPTCQEQVGAATGIFVFCNIHKKTPVFESHFNKVAGLQAILKFLISIIFTETSLVSVCWSSVVVTFTSSLL